MSEGDIRQVVLLIVDISGYTRFMVSNKMDMIHSQFIITELMKAIIKEVDIPLEVAKLEGDAVFLYAVRESDPVVWENHRKEISSKMLRFFEVFSSRMAQLIHANTCPCKSCTNISYLRVKVVVHSGEAYFYKIGKFDELSGVDVITVHRLLKNSLKSNQYLLMTENAYEDLNMKDIQFGEGLESYGDDDIGDIKTYLYLPPQTYQDTVNTVTIRHYGSLWNKMKNMFHKMGVTMMAMMKLKRFRTFNHLPTINVAFDLDAQKGDQ